MCVYTLTHMYMLLCIHYRNVVTPPLPESYSSPKMWSITGIWPVIIPVYKRGGHNSEGYGL